MAWCVNRFPSINQWITHAVCGNPPRFPHPWCLGFFVLPRSALLTAFLMAIFRAACNGLEAALASTLVRQLSLWCLKLDMLDPIRCKLKTPTPIPTQTTLCRRAGLYRCQIRHLFACLISQLKARQLCPQQHQNAGWQLAAAQFLGNSNQAANPWNARSLQNCATCQLDPGKNPHPSLVWQKLQ